MEQRMQPGPLTRARPKTPRAAAIAGILFRYWITLPGYALAALLLLSSRFVDWLPLAFPLWVLVLSIYILVENLRGTKSGAAG
jgi:hypothetical protein